MLVKLVQPLNAAAPILVTLSGIVMLVKLLQPSKAEFPTDSPLVITTLCKLVLRI